MPRRAAVLLLAAALTGCAQLAVRTPTPAAKLTKADLAEPPPPPDETYYIIVFGSQSRPKKPALTHTWAIAVKATGAPGCGAAVEPHTISWMPATLEIKTRSRAVEPGVNLGPRDTLAWALGTKQHVSMWGPYQVPHTAFRRFLVQEAFMRSGAVGYQCIDTIGEAGRTGKGCDCYHAITDMDPEYSRGRYPLFRYGESASRRVVQELHRRDVLLNPEHTHDWLLPALGLEKYPVERQPLPHSPLLGL